MILKALICSRLASMDIGTGFVSLFNVLEDFATTNFPIVLHNLSVLFIIQKEVGDNDSAPFSLRLMSDGKQTAEFPILSEFSGKDTNKTLVNLQNVLIQNPGIFEVLLIYKEQQLGRFWINAQLLSQVSATNTPPTVATPEE